MAVASFSRIHEVLVILFINSILNTTWQRQRQALFVVSPFAWRSTGRRRSCGMHDISRPFQRLIKVLFRQAMSQPLLFARLVKTGIGFRGPVSDGIADWALDARIIVENTSSKEP